MFSDAVACWKELRQLLKIKQDRCGYRAFEHRVSKDKTLVFAVWDIQDGKIDRFRNLITEWKSLLLTGDNNLSIKQLAECEGKQIFLHKVAKKSYGEAPEEGDRCFLVTLYHKVGPRKNEISIGYTTRGNKGLREQFAQVIPRDSINSELEIVLHMAPIPGNPKKKNRFKGLRLRFSM